MSIRRREFLTGLTAAGATTLAGSKAFAQQEGGGASAKWAATPPPKPGPVLKYSKPIIDAHFHWRPQEFYDLIAKEGEKEGGIWNVGKNKQGNFTGRLPGYHPYNGGGITVPAQRPANEVESILKSMTDRRVDMCTVTQTNPHVIWAPPGFGLKLAKALNDGTSALCVEQPKRFTGAITLPMQDVKASLEELERARKLPGMKAVNITENIAGKNIGDKEFWPVYARCEQLNLAIFLHNVDPFWERLEEGDYTMMNVLGNPFEATMAATSLVLSGAMDEFPKLDVYFPHSGGFFPFVTPRMDWSMGTAEYMNRGRTKSFGNLKMPRASDYRRRFHYDLILHDPKITRMLIDLVGADRVACGTDYPQGMGVMRPVDYVELIPGITQKEAEMILCENPARLLRL